MLAQLCAGASLKLLPWQPLSTGSPNVEAVRDGSHWWGWWAEETILVLTAWCCRLLLCCMWGRLEPFPLPTLITPCAPWHRLIAFICVGLHPCLDPIGLWYRSNITHCMGKPFFERDQKISGKSGEEPSPQQNKPLSGCQLAAVTAHDVR